MRRREREGSAAASGVVEVRSTFTLTWTPLPKFTQAFVSVSASTSAFDAALDDHVNLPVGMWAMRDVCVGYGPPTPILPSYTNNVRPGQFSNRPMILMQAGRAGRARDQGDHTGDADDSSHLSSPQLLWPLRWPRHYADGDPSPFRSEPYGLQDAFFADITRAFAWTHDAALRDSHYDRRRARDRWADQNLTAQWADQPAAVVIESTMDNLFHALFHALPLREDMLVLHRPLMWLAQQLQRRAAPASQQARRSSEQRSQRQDRGDPRVTPPLTPSPTDGPQVTPPLTLPPTDDPRVEVGGCRGIRCFGRQTRAPAIGSDGS